MESQSIILIEDYTLHTFQMFLCQFSNPINPDIRSNEVRRPNHVYKLLQNIHISNEPLSDRKELFRQNFFTFSSEYFVRVFTIVLLNFIIK
jgi:hypothetical protein